MRQFNCICGAALFFDNHQCLACGRQVGFDSERFELVALEESPSGPATRSDPNVPNQLLGPEGRAYLRCDNRERSGCPWLVSPYASPRLCVACRLNRKIPDLSVSQDEDAWHQVEEAKRRWVYGLLRLGLPVRSKSEDPTGGLVLDVLRPTATQQVFTGHSNGVITINLNEADPVAREVTQQQMQERYRTLLGHLRHESGHYYFAQLVESNRLGPAWIERFRQLFGDERVDYAQALQNHYEVGPPPNFKQQFVSRYASTHPWEDFAESWAHYLHLFDGLETARALNLLRVPSLDLAARTTGFEHEVFEALIEAWIELTVCMNALNRSLGLRDCYPFVLTPIIREKLRYVHELILAV